MNAQKCSLLSFVNIDQIEVLRDPAEAQTESLAVGPKIRMEGIVAQRGMGDRKKPDGKDPEGTKHPFRMIGRAAEGIAPAGGQSD